MWKEFKAFIASDNVLTMAVGIIMGTAFTAIINSLVNDIFMPIIVSLTGAADVSHWAIQIGNTQLMVGNFLQAVINFLLIALFLFSILKSLSRASGRNLLNPDADAEPAGPSETELLEDILEELRKK